MKGGRCKDDISERFKCKDDVSDLPTVPVEASVQIQVSTGDTQPITGDRSIN